MNEPENDTRTWSDKLKQLIKPQWMVERDKKRPPGKKDWRPGHLLWVMTLGSPAEVDALLEGRGHEAEAKDAVKTSWQERESQQRTRNPAKENAGALER